MGDLRDMSPTSSCVSWPSESSSPHDFLRSHTAACHEPPLSPQSMLSAAELNGQVRIAEARRLGGVVAAVSQARLGPHGLMRVALAPSPPPLPGLLKAQCRTGRASHVIPHDLTTDLPVPRARDDHVAVGQQLQRPHPRLVRVRQAVASDIGHAGRQPIVPRVRAGADKESGDEGAPHQPLLALSSVTGGGVRGRRRRVSA